MPDGLLRNDRQQSRRLAGWLQGVNYENPKLRNYLLGYLIGGGGSLLFLYFKLPLPWFLAIPTRAVLGVAVGTAFTPALVGKINGMLGSLMMIVPFMVLVVLAGRFYFERFARFDKPTAFFCAVPGGLTDMISMGLDAGANIRAVTLIQATRIVLIVFFLPFWIQHFGGRRIASALPPGVHIWQFGLIDAAVLAGLGWAGWQLAVRLGFAGAPLVGPMILSGLAHAFGLTAARVPLEIMVFAQITLGIALGAQFRGVTLSEISSTMTWGVGFSLCLIILTATVALIVSRITGFDSTTVLLAYAPGGQTELNLLAFILGLDVAFTALHHLVRLAVVIFGAQLVFAQNKQWREGRRDQI
jgi:membrane AbrB-like protein